MTLKRGWTEEPDGLWYRRLNGSQRGRGRWRTCESCGERFPSLIGNPGRYCSKVCTFRAVGGSNRASRPDLFTQWTPEECWLAGLLWADGHYSVQGAKVAVQVGLTDEEIIGAAASITGCRYRTYEQPIRDGYQRKPIHRLSFGERHAVGRLVTAGFAEKPLGWPSLPHPRSFLRGAFDGDGSVTLYQQGGRRKTANTPWRLHACLCGTEPFLEGVQAFLANWGITPKKIRAHNGTWCAQWNHRDSLTLAEVIYSEPGPCLARKRDVFARSATI